MVNFDESIINKNGKQPVNWDPLIIKATGYFSDFKEDYGKFTITQAGGGYVAGRD